MKLIFLGTGSAFTLAKDNFHSNMVLENSDGKRLLVDCGSDARRSLSEQGLSYKDIENVYISHLHDDHAGGLEWLAITRKFDRTCKRPKLYISKNLINDLWNKVLAGGLNTLEGQIVDISTYFEVIPLEENTPFSWGGVDFNLVQTIHVVSGFCLIPSYGLLFRTNNQTVFLTTDAQLAPHQINDFYNKATIIFQDCETSDAASGVHAHYRELKFLPPEIKAKIWLYHYSIGNLPDAKKDGFRGFVKMGQRFDFCDDSTLF